MTEDKALEYQQVAALVCMDVELLHDISQQTNITLEELKDQIDLVVENMHELQTNEAMRKMRYDACCLLFSLPVVNDESSVP